MTPAYFKQLPIFPADAATQAELVALVDELLAHHAALNVLREQNYVIRTKQDGTREIVVPYDILLRNLQKKDNNFPAVSLFNGRAAGLFRLPDNCDPAAQISHVFTPNRYPNTVVLHANQLWLEVDEEPTRRYLLNYLARPQWKGRSFDEISDSALMPESSAAFATLYDSEARIIMDIQTRLAAIATADASIDSRVLDLYGITDPADRARILGEAPPDETAELEEAEEGEASPPTG